MGTYETFTKHLWLTLDNLEAFLFRFFVNEDSKKIDLFVNLEKNFYIYIHLTG